MTDVQSVNLGANLKAGTAGRNKAPQQKDKLSCGWENLIKFEEKKKETINSINDYLKYISDSTELEEIKKAENEPIQKQEPQFG